MGYSTLGGRLGGRPSRLRGGKPQWDDTSYRDALHWANRIMRGEELEFHLADLCLSTLQKHLATLVRHIPMERERQTYRGLCPGCGRAVELERGDE